MRGCSRGSTWSPGLNLRAQHGFTLLEVLVATAISTLIGTVVWGMLFSLSATRKTTQVETEVYQSLRQAAMVIVEEGRTAVKVECLSGYLYMFPDWTSIPNYEGDPTQTAQKAVKLQVIPTASLRTGDLHRLTGLFITIESSGSGGHRFEVDPGGDSVVARNLLMETSLTCSNLKVAQANLRAPSSSRFNPILAQDVIVLVRQ